MKKILTVLFFVTLFFQAMSQKGQFGFQLNPLITIMNTDQLNDKAIVPDQLIYEPYKFGYKAGIIYNYMLTEKLAITPALSFNYLVYGFKQILYDNGAIASFTDNFGFGSFELSVILKKYLKVNDNQFFTFKLGGSVASTKFWAYSSSGSVVIDSASTGGSSYSSGAIDENATFNPGIIAGVSIINTLQSKNKLEIGLTYNYRFSPVPAYSSQRSVNNLKYYTTVSPALSYISLDIIYYFKPFGNKETK